MGLDDLFKGDNNALRSIGNILGAIGKFGGDGKGTSRSSGSKSNVRLCNSKVISMEDAYNKIIEGNCLVLDVRTQNEYKIMKIKGAVNIPLDKLELNMLKLEPNKDREILVYCATGSRSKVAVQILYKLGYKNVFVWDGAGINNFKYLDVIEKNENMVGSTNIM